MQRLYGIFHAVEKNVIFFFLWGDLKGELPRSKTKSWVVSVLLCSVLGQLCGLVHGLPVCGSFHSKNKLTFFPLPSTIGHLINTNCSRNKLTFSVVEVRPPV